MAGADADVSGKWKDRGGRGWGGRKRREPRMQHGGTRFLTSRGRCPLRAICEIRGFVFACCKVVSANPCCERTCNYFVKTRPVSDFSGNIGPARSSIHIGMCAMCITCYLLFDKLVKLNNVHHGGGDRPVVDGNPRFRPWCQPAGRVEWENVWFLTAQVDARRENLSTRRKRLIGKEFGFQTGKKWPKSVSTRSQEPAKPSVEKN